MSIPQDTLHALLADNSFNKLLGTCNFMAGNPMETPPRAEDVTVLMEPTWLIRVTVRGPNGNVTITCEPPTEETRQ